MNDYKPTCCNCAGARLVDVFYQPVYRCPHDAARFKDGTHTCERHQPRLCGSCGYGKLYSSSGPCEYHLCCQAPASVPPSWPKSASMQRSLMQATDGLGCLAWKPKEETK